MSNRPVIQASHGLVDSTHSRQRSYKKDEDPSLIHSIFEFEKNGRLAKGSPKRKELAVSLTTRTLLRRYAADKSKRDGNPNIQTQKDPNTHLSRTAGRFGRGQLGTKLGLHFSLQHTARSFSKEMQSVSQDEGPFSVQKSVLSVFENVSKPKIVTLPNLAGPKTTRVVNAAVPCSGELGISSISGFGYFTHEGVLMNNNEDRVMLTAPNDAKLPEGCDFVSLVQVSDWKLADLLRLIGYAMFAIFDGHGGSKASEYCKQNFPSQFLKCLLENFKADIASKLRGTEVQIPQDRIDNCIKGFCKSFDMQLVNYLAGSSVDEKSGTSTVVVFTFFTKTYLFQIGNCKALLMATGPDSKLQYLTTEHTPAVKSEADRVCKNGGNIMRPSISGASQSRERKTGSYPSFPPRRAKLRIFPGHLPISRSLGDYHLKRGYPGLLSNEPDVLQIDSQFNYLLLGSAGLFEAVKLDTLFSEFVKTILEQHNFGTDRAACEAVCAALSQKVLELQPKNNFSAILMCSTEFRKPYQIVESEVASTNNPKLNLIRKQVRYESFRHPK